MTKKEQIKAEIDNLTEEDLEELHAIIKKFVQTRATSNKSSLMSQLRTIKVDAPEDFSTHLDQYASGEKIIE